MAAWVSVRRIFLDNNEILECANFSYWLSFGKIGINQSSKD